MRKDKCPDCDSDNLAYTIGAPEIPSDAIVAICNDCGKNITLRDTY